MSIITANCVRNVGVRSMLAYANCAWYSLQTSSTGPSMRRSPFSIRTARCRCARSGPWNGSRTVRLCSRYFLFWLRSKQAFGECVRGVDQFIDSFRASSVAINLFSIQVQHQDEWVESLRVVFYVSGPIFDGDATVNVGSSVPQLTVVGAYIP